ncbi:MAG: FKBP-type peptidyl-prolyl cis-trans isomerase [Clostridia bacterium]|nr:FKBP-type peptidyl-prolyl cis-trans isomerase [Clostridia bacterium]
MKKRLLCLALVSIMLLGVLTSCFKSDKKYDYNMVDYVTLPEYKATTVKFYLDELQASIDQQLIEYATEYTVKKGDDIYIDLNVYRADEFQDENGKIKYNQGAKIEEISKSNYLLKNVGAGSISNIIENTIIGANIGDIVSKNYTDVVLGDFYAEEYRDAKLFIDVKVMNRQVGLGDIVTVSYKGYNLDASGNIAKNDKGEDDIFDENDSAAFFVGSHLAIDDFENALVGMLLGKENKKLFEATFPEDYSDDAFKGKTVKFEVTVNDIYVAPVYDDAFIKKYYYAEHGYQTVAEFEEALINQYAVAYVWNLIDKDVKIIEYPAAEYNTAMAELSEIESTFETQYGITLDKYLQEEYDMTREEYVKSNLKTEMIYYTVSQIESIYPSDAELKREREYLIDYYKNYYMQNSSMNADTALTTATEFVDNLGDLYVYEDVLFDLVEDHFLKSCTIEKVDRTYESISQVIARGEAPEDK